MLYRSFVFILKKPFRRRRLDLLCFIRKLSKRYPENPVDPVYTNIVLRAFSHTDVFENTDP